jgi:hypothetical protein
MKKSISKPSDSSFSTGIHFGNLLSQFFLLNHTMRFSVDMRYVEIKIKVGTHYTELAISALMLAATRRQRTPLTQKSDFLRAGFLFLSQQTA